MQLKISIGFFIACILMITVFKSKFKGDIGEIAVASMLKELDRKKYIKLHDIKLINPSQKTKTTQIDHLVVSTYGIFCIETKAYKGKIYGGEFSKEWTQYLSNSQHKFMNPLFQNYGHIKAVESIIKNDYPNLPYFSIIAFSAEANLSSIDVKKAKVCKISQLSDVIKSLSTNEIISEEELIKLVKLIEANKSYQMDILHSREINKVKKENQEKIRQNICPKCGSELVERQGKYGKFTGCSNFPKCRITINTK